MKPKVITVIPARGGSKGVPRKNVKLLNGKPLIAYTIEASLNSGVVDRVFISTDDAEIAEVAKKFGAEVIDRPAELAGDKVTLEPVIKHALDYLREKENCRKVVKGQEIKTTNQVIGLEGTTGWSTGAHLHFEIRVFGIPVNPRTFLEGNPN